MAKQTSTLCLFTFLLFTGARIRASSAENFWEAWQSLIGDWVGEGQGRPGNGAGNFSFNFDLQKKVIVRRNRADYPASPGRVASSHEDLMVIYPKESGKQIQAIYFDSEGHVIDYTAQFSPDRQVLTFLSEAVPSRPRFRLSYTKAEKSTLKVKFERAPPGKPDAFALYLTQT